MDETIWTQDVNWTCIRRWGDVLDVSSTSHVCSIYVLCFGESKLFHVDHCALGYHKEIKLICPKLE